MIKFVPHAVWLALLGHLTGSAQESSPVTSTLDVEEAWMGQEVRLTVILQSPGPFSGTARFKVPEIAGTLFVYQGNPIVGSTTVGGESLITQRHDFRIFTQQDGTLEVPAIPVDYESKNDFLGDPVPRSGSTDPLRFESKRPPGTEGLPLVLTSRSLEVEQTWSPLEGKGPLEAGTVIERRVTRKANDTTAMMFAPITPAPIEGVRIYPGDPQVTDKRERGVTTASRTDTLRYQLVEGGEIAIPPLEFQWWNPESETVEAVTLEGITVRVKAAPRAPEPLDYRTLAIPVLGGAALAGLFLKLGWPWMRSRFRAWHARRRSPEAKAARALARACRANDAIAAYRALTEWRRATGIDVVLGEALAREALLLSCRLYNGKEPDGAWSGRALLEAFGSEQRTRREQARSRRVSEALPPLNPSFVQR